MPKWTDFLDKITNCESTFDKRRELFQEYDNDINWDNIVIASITIFSEPLYNILLQIYKDDNNAKYSERFRTILDNLIIIKEKGESNYVEVKKKLDFIFENIDSTELDPVLPTNVYLSTLMKNIFLGKESDKSYNILQKLVIDIQNRKIK